MRTVKALYFLLLVLVYVPLVLHGGFGTSDDLSFVANYTEGFQAELQASLSRIGHVSRPLYALLQVFSLELFGTVPVYYTLLRLALWFLSAWVLFRTFKPLIGQKGAWLFLFLFSFPVFTSAQLFNCFQGGYLLALFFWALSLKLQMKDSAITVLRSVLALALLALSLLSCELFFPLFLLNVALPQLVGEDRAALNVGRLIRSILPVLALLLAYLVFKFSISSGQAPYGFDLSGFTLMQSAYFFFSITAGVVLLLVETIPHLFNTPWAWTALLAFPLLFFLAKGKPAQGRRLDLWAIAKLLLLSLALCFFVFLLSGYPAVTYGNYNKMMLPAFVAFCLLLAHVLSKWLNSNRWWYLAVLLFLWVFCINVQVINFNHSWEIRKGILADMAKQLNDTDLGADPVVLANLPYFTPNDLNSEHVFWLHWDLAAGAYLFGLEVPVELFPFCHRTLMDERIYPLHNVNSYVQQLQTSNLWVYESEGLEQGAELFQIQDFEAYRAKRALQPLNDHRLNLRAGFRQRLKERLQ